MEEMIKIDYEVVVKYHGDILILESKLNVSVELLACNFAIITAKSQDVIGELLNYPQVEHIETPFLLNEQDLESFTSTGITSFKQSTNLTGSGVILGMIDSGIDYRLPQFKDKEGKSKILYYWDQCINGNPPEGFKTGTLYNNNDINESIQGKNIIPISPTNKHGTHIAGISAEIAPDANLIVVRVGTNKTCSTAKSTDFMRAIEFILTKSKGLNMPVALNISYGSGEGAHMGMSLFEQYINQMSSYWKNNIIVAAGNNADKGRHKSIEIKDKMSKTEVEFVIGRNEKTLNINIWPDFADNFSVYLVSPSNQSTKPISLTSGVIKNIIDNTKIKGFYFSVPPDQLVRRLIIQLTSDEYITPGVWKIVFSPITVITGNIDLYISEVERLNTETKFLSPTKKLTITLPGSAKQVFTVGSYNTKTDLVSDFSGQGDIERCMFKPDLLAPGEGVTLLIPGGDGKALSGTSISSAHATGIVALLFQWGIVQKNDETLYGQKLKALLIRSARRKSNFRYPSNSSGYGYLYLSDISLNLVIEINKENLIYRSKKKNKRKREPRYVRQVLKGIDQLEVGFNLIHGPGLEEALSKLDAIYRYYKISDNFGIVFTNPSKLWYIDEVLTLGNIKRSEYFARLAKMSVVSQGTSGGTVALEDIGANYFKNNPNVSISGKGVFIAIIDSGIDYLHEDFIYPDRTSKVAFLWDQSKDGKPPKGFSIGTEYTNEDINKAIQNNDATLSVDEEGSGTMLSGICAGLGNLNKEYAGVAEDAELIVVKMRKIGGYYNNAMLYAAIEYITQKSLELKTPVVINISLGTNNMVQLNSRVIEERTFFTRGICLVAATGNEGNAQTHTSGQMKFKEDINEIEIEVAEDEPLLEIQVIVNRPDKIKVGIVSPSNEESRLLEVSNYNEITGLFDLEGTEYLITYIYPTLYSGQQQATITLINVTKGIWKLRLVGQYITNGRYEVYLQNRVFLKPGTKFRDPDPGNTINYPAVYEDIISIGAYDTKNDNLWPQSSKGPTVEGSLKPAIVAPGVDIIAPYPGNKYATITGTAAAAAYTSGAVALYLQYTLVDRRYMNRGFVQQIRTYLRAGAKRSANISYPNYGYGYGLLNIKGVFDQLR